MGGLLFGSAHKLLVSFLPLYNKEAWMAATSDFEGIGSLLFHAVPFKWGPLLDFGCSKAKSKVAGAQS